MAILQFQASPHFSHRNKGFLGQVDWRCTLEIHVGIHEFSVHESSRQNWAGNEHGAAIRSAHSIDLPLFRGPESTGPVVAEELSNMQSACRMQSTRCVWRYVPCIDCDGRVGVWLVRPKEAVLIVFYNFESLRTQSLDGGIDTDSSWSFPAGITSKAKKNSQFLWVF